MYGKSLHPSPTNCKVVQPVPSMDPIITTLKRNKFWEYMWANWQQERTSRRCCSFVLPVIYKYNNDRKRYLLTTRFDILVRDFKKPVDNTVAVALWWKFGQLFPMNVSFLDHHVFVESSLASPIKTYCELTPKKRQFVFALTFKYSAF